MGEILVVEDNINTRENILELLSECGHKAYGAEDGLKGLSLAKQILPDLIISDIMMPGLDGFGLLNELSNDPMTEDIPFILLSARSEPYDIRSGMSLGAEDYITKPFKAAELLKAVEVRLRKKEVREAKLKSLTDNISLSLPHELRTPLVAIMGYSQLLKDENNGLEWNDVFDMSERIHYAGSRLNTTIEKFLIYSEIEYTLMDREQLKRIRDLTCHSVSAIIRQAAEKILNKYSRLNDAVFDISDASLRINEAYLGYIVSELTDNACKFSEPGSHIKISGRSNHTVYELEILDMGRGMSAEQIANVRAGCQFEKDYYQQSGNGLGLAIVKGMTQLHGGEMKIESKKNSYTSIYVSIPLYN